MKHLRPVLIALFALTVTELTHIKVAAATEAEGAPGLRHDWAPARKDAMGVAFEQGTARSPVWFSLAEGILSEIYYPSIDRPQVGDLQILVTDGVSYFSEQKRDVRYRAQYLSDQGLVVRVSGEERGGNYRISQTVVTDPQSAALRVETRLTLNRPGLKVFVLFKPAIQGRASDDHARWDAINGALIASDSGFETPASAFSAHAALLTRPPLSQGSVGYVGTSDGWQDLSRHFKLTRLATHAGPGNVALVGEVPIQGGNEAVFEISLGFGASRSAALSTARRSLARNFASIQAEYANGWRTYQAGLLPFAGLDASLIRAHEDKLYPGAVIASLSQPAIPEGDRSLEPLDPSVRTGGYHLVWPRDLYHSAMGLLAAGDHLSPVRILHYLLERQNADGGWHQNFWVDGTPYWTGIQLDEIAFPILLAAHLKARGLIELDSGKLQSLRRAAQYLAQHGPFSQQDRWEEIGGAIPSTLAAVIAALRAYAQLSGEPQYWNLADRWQSRLEDWTRVPVGPLGTQYFLRVSLSGDASLNERFDIANGGGPARTQEVLDGGFLELVRLGVRSATDLGVLNTLALYLNPANQVSKPSAAHPGAYLHKRYTRDAYGTDRRGREWPLLTGESGHYFVASGDFSRARASLAELESQALPSGLIPEQTEGMGVATPLVWAHAELIRLRRSIQEGRVFDFPPQFADH